MSNTHSDGARQQHHKLLTLQCDVIKQIVSITIAKFLRHVHRQLTQLTLALSNENNYVKVHYRYLKVAECLRCGLSLAFRHDQASK